MKKQVVFRYAIFEILPNIIRKEEGSNGKVRIGGIAGREIEDFMHRVLDGHYNGSMVWTNEGESVGTLINGSYDGVLGLFQRKEAELLPFPYALDRENEIVRYSSFMTNAVTGHIMNTPPVGYSSHDLIECLETFKKSIWLTTILSVAVLSIAFRLFKNTTNIVDAFYALAAFLIAQVLTLPKCFLLILTWFSFSFLTNTFLQGMNADLIKIDYSKVIDSIEDLERMNDVRAVFVRDGPFVEYFRRPTNPTFKKIWDRSARSGKPFVFKMDPREFNKGVSKTERIALVSTQHITKVAAHFGCCRDRSKRTWISRRPFKETILTFYGSPFVNKAILKDVDRLTYPLSEGGHVAKSWDKVSENLVGSLLQTQVTFTCLPTTMDEMILSKDGEYRIQLSNMKRLGLSFLCFIIVSALMFLLELV